MHKRLLPLLILLACLASPASAQTVPDGNPIKRYLPAISNIVPHDWLGPEGGLITAIAFDPKSAETVYAGTWVGGVYKSLDGGATWRRASHGLGNLKIDALAADPSQPGVVYAGTYGGKMYKTTDGGGSWRYTSNGIQDGAIVYSIVVDPKDTKRVFIATRGSDTNNHRPWAGVVYRSEDGGESWTPVLANLGGADYQDWVYGLAINPNAPNTLFAATHEHGPLRSLDYGQTWKILTEGISNHSTRAVVIDPRLDYRETVYTGVWTKDGVFKSNDNGGSWTLMDNGISGAQIFRMSINPFNPAILYSATYNMGVMKSTNAARKWASSGLGSVGISSIQVSPFEGNTVFAGTDEDGLYKSLDGGGSWLHSQAGLTARSVTALVVGPNDPAAYYISLDGSGVMRSLDNGQTWERFGANLSDRLIHALVKHPLSNTLFALTDTSGLYRCNLDAPAKCWQPVGIKSLLQYDQATPPEPKSFLELFSPGATDDSPADGAPLAPETTAPLLTLVFAPGEANIAYLGTQGAGIYRSADGGNTWGPTAWRTQRVASIAIHPLNPNRIYATTGQPETIGFSNDGGANWSDVRLPGQTATALAISPSRPDQLLVGSQNGVFLAENGSLTQLGLAGQAVTAIALHPALPNAIFVATTNGAWLSLDSGKTWLAGPPELNEIPVNSISFSPHNAHQIFYNSAANGILRTGIDR